MLVYSGELESSPPWAVQFRLGGMGALGEHCGRTESIVTSEVGRSPQREDARIGELYWDQPSWAIPAMWNLP